MTLTEAAQYIGLPAGVVHSMAWSGEIKTELPKRYWRPTFSRADLDAWLQRHGINKG